MSERNWRVEVIKTSVAYIQVLPGKYACSGIDIRMNTYISTVEGDRNFDIKLMWDCCHVCHCPCFSIICEAFVRTRPSCHAPAHKCGILKFYMGKQNYWEYILRGTTRPWQFAAVALLILAVFSWCSQQVISVSHPAEIKWNRCGFCMDFYRDRFSLEILTAAVALLMIQFCCCDLLPLLVDLLVIHLQGTLWVTVHVNVDVLK